MFGKFFRRNDKKRAEVRKLAEGRLQKLSDAVSECMDFFKEHPAEYDELFDKMSEVQATYLAAATIKTPHLLMASDAVTSFGVICSTYGYYLGRTYVDIPDAIKKGMKKEMGGDKT